MLIKPKLRAASLKKKKRFLLHILDIKASQVSCSKHWTFLPAERSLSPPSEDVRQEDSLQSLCIFLHYLQQHSLCRKLSFHKRHETVKVTATSCMHDYTENSYMLSGSAFISNLCGFLCSGLPIFSHLGCLQCSRVPGFTFIFLCPRCDILYQKGK